MINFSKLRELSLPYNCYEVGHTWTPECSEAALTIGYTCFMEGMKIYAPLYLFSQAVQKKFTWKAFLETIQSSYTSSCFLSTNGFAFIFIFCWLRKLMGKFYYLHCSYFPAFVASFLAILVERESRRGPLALYVTNVASETIFRMAVSRGIIKPLPNGEIYLFSTVMAFYLFIIRKQGFTRDFISVGLKYLLGRDEAKPRTKTADVTNHIKKESLSPSKSNQNLSYFPKIWNCLKHESCPHSGSCLKYCLKGFGYPFLTGYTAFTLIRCIFMINKIISNPSLLMKTLKDGRTMNLGIFLGGFSGTFRLVNCLCRWIFRTDREIYAIPAAFLGGLFMKYFPSSTMSLYLMWKLIELLYLMGMKNSVLPRIQGSMLFLYSVSTAVLFYAAVLEPHNLKPAYLKFLSRITHDRIGAINRHVLDIFGTHASKLYSNFWPDLDLSHCSRVFQESVLLWLIH